MDADLEQGDKVMRLRYAGICRLCGLALAVKQEAVYERASKTVRCVQCGAEPVESRPDVAGGSARREYERRKQARDDRIRTKHPKLGGLILALSDDPQSTRAWEQGAIGEELLAARMKDLPETTQVLHDRRVPGTRANIDHIIVAPSGVWVVDAKRYKGRPALQVDGGIFRPRVESLRVAGRDKTKLVAGVQTQVERVATAVNDPTVPVTGALCFIEADWPLIGGSFTVNGVHVLWPRLLVKRLTTAIETNVDVDAVATRLAGAFPRAV